MPSHTVSTHGLAHSCNNSYASCNNGYANEIGTYRAIIRVKSDQLEEEVAAVSALGKVQNKRLSGQDVTSEYLQTLPISSVSQRFL